MSKRSLFHVFVGLVALVGAPLAVVAFDAGDAGATSVNDEASFRLAFANDAVITFTGNVTISTCGTPPTRNSGTPVAIDGGGFTLLQTCTGVNAMEQDGTGALNVSNLTIQGGRTGIDANAPVTLTNSTITGVTNTNSAEAIDSNGDVTLVNSSITNTTATANSGSATAINAGGNVSLTNSSISGTVASNAGGNAFAINCAGNVTLDGSSISGTAANDTNGSAFGVDCGGDVVLTGSGSSISGTAGSPGGDAFGIDNGGSVTLINSSVSATTSGGDSFGIDNGGAVTLTDSQVLGTVGGAEGFGIDNGGSVTLVRSTISGTSGPSFAAAIDTGGAVNLTNSTIANNAAFAIQPGGPVTLVYSDVVGNGASFVANAVPNTNSDPHARGPFGPSASGTRAAAVTLDAQIDHDGQTVTTFASVIAKPQGGFVNCSGGAATTSNGYNFADDSTCGLTGTGDRQGTGLDPLLGALANNGGPTQTFLPQTGSPLIDFVPLASCTADGAAGITTDQRGSARPSGSGCEIGSVEILVPTPVVILPAFTG